MMYSQPSLSDQPVPRHLPPEPDWPLLRQPVELPAWGGAAEPGPDSHRLRISPIHRLEGGALCGAEIDALPLPVLTVSGDEMQRLPPAPDTDWLLRAACGQAMGWRRLLPAGGGLKVTVSLPSRALAINTIAAQADSACRMRHLPAHLLEVALPMTAMAEEGLEILLVASALRDLGAGVALDWTGSGPGCHRVLRRLPLTSLRLHPSVLCDLEDSASARRVVRDTIGVAHAAGATTVALGVATALRRDILADLHCDAALGPLFTEKLSVHSFAEAMAWATI